LTSYSNYSNQIDKVGVQIILFSKKHTFSSLKMLTLSVIACVTLIFNTTL